MGLGNKSNGGRFNRLWRGRRRKRWRAAIAAQPVPPPPVSPLWQSGSVAWAEQYEEGPTTYQSGPVDWSKVADQGDVAQGGPVDWAHQYDEGLAAQSGPVDWAHQHDETASAQSGPVDWAHQHDETPVAQSGPVDWAHQHEASVTAQSGPVVLYGLYAQATAAFSEPARSLVTGRGYTQSSPTTLRQLDAVPTLSLTAAGGSYQLASLPTADGDTLFTQVELECTAGVGITVDAVVRVEDQDGNVMIPSTTLTNFRLAGAVFSLVAVGLTRVLQQNVLTGAVLFLVLVTPATGTTLTATARVIGFPVS